MTPSNLWTHILVLHARFIVDVLSWRTLQHTATHRNILQHTATHGNTLQHSAVPCSTLQHTATHNNTLRHTATHYSTLQYTATHCNTLQHTATHCNTLQYTATHCNNLTKVCWHIHSGSFLLVLWLTLRHTATHCNTLQHTATHCNTLWTHTFRVIHARFMTLWIITSRMCVWFNESWLIESSLVQPIAFGVSFLQSRNSINYLVLYVSFAAFRWKETYESETANCDWVTLQMQ